MFLRKSSRSIWSVCISKRVLQIIYKETVEVFKGQVEVAKALIEMGAKTEDVFDWLKKDKDLNIGSIEIDSDVDGLTGYDDLMSLGKEVPDVGQDVTRSLNYWVDNPKGWITMSHQPVPLEEGQTPKEAGRRFLEEKGRLGKDKSSTSSSPKEIEVVKETQKALKIKKEGKEFWIQKRWLREDGSLTAAGQKAFEEARTPEEEQKYKEELSREWTEGVKLPKADWESDKAYGFDIQLDFYDTEIRKRHRIFIPKSVIQPNGNIPTWLLEKKVEEISQAYPRSRYGDFFIEKHPFEKELGDKDISFYGESKEQRKTDNEIFTYYRGRVFNVKVDKLIGDGGEYDIEQIDFVDDIVCQNAWEESKHKRDKDGKFSSTDEDSGTDEGIKEVIEKAHKTPSEHLTLDLGEVSEKIIKAAKEKGFNIEGYSHLLDVSGVRHAFLKHGVSGLEEARGQEAITDKDIFKIPEIIDSFDTIDFPGKNKIGRDLIRYSKRFKDGTTYYVEEIRTGKKKLAIQTLYKRGQ